VHEKYFQAGIGMRVVARAQMSAALLLGLATAGPVAAQQFN
jgi:hypothetical protein